MYKEVPPFLSRFHFLTVCFLLEKLAPGSKLWLAFFFLNEK
jgi:hypothetical protein